MLNKGKILQLVVGVLEVNVKTDVEIVLEISNDTVNWSLFSDKFKYKLNPKLLLNLSIDNNRQLEDLVELSKGDFTELAELYNGFQQATEYELSQEVILKYNNKFKTFCALYFDGERVDKSILVAFLIYNHIKGGDCVKL